MIRPAAYCGIVGFKPSYKRVDSSGLVTFSPSADHVGFFTQSVADMQRVAAVAIDDWNQNVVATGEASFWHFLMARILSNAVR